MAREQWEEVSFQTIIDENGDMHSGYFPTGEGVVDGNIAVDYVWGNFPLQPNDDRTDDYTSIGGGEGDNGYDSTFTISSDVLRTDDYTFEINGVPAFAYADNHINATTSYQGFPSFIQGAPYDDTVANATVPNVVSLTETAATTALNNAGLVKGAVTTANNAAGATALNNGKVKTQTPAAGTTVNTGSAVALVKYAYVAPVTTGPVSGINRTGAGTSFSLNGNQAIMYVVGRTVKPTVGWTISLAGTDNATHNVSWTVEAVENNDSYNSGGTAVKITLVSGTFTGATSTGGTWTKL